MKSFLLKSLPSGLELQGVSEPLDAVVVLPDSDGEKMVQRVADAAFFGETNPTTLTIPQGVQEIGVSAFEGWLELKEVELPDSLVTIAARAFAQCMSLEYLDLPDTVQMIGAFAFSENTALKAVKLPKRLRMIGLGAFANNSNLEEFQIDPANPNYATRDGVLFSKDGRALIAYPANKKGEVYAVPRGVVEISPHAFSGARNLRRLELPDTLQTIQDSAFEDASIQEIETPKSLSFIASRAFFNCQALTSFVTPSESELRLIQANAFANCKCLTQVELPESLKEIDARAFFNCVELQRLRIPNQIKSLPDEIVAGCEKLTTVILPESLSIIGRAAFAGCRNLEEPKLPASVTRIGAFAFKDCQSLVSITLPRALQAMGVGIFTGAERLKFISLDPANATYAVNDGALFTKGGKKLICFPAGLEQNTYFIPEKVEAIASRAFSGAKNLQSVSILNNVKTIGDGAFENCSGLLAVVIPSSVKELASSLFRNCSNLRSVTLYPTLTSIGARAFAGCASLAAITLPDSLETIGDFAFENCGSLVSITLGDHVATLGANPFCGCSSLVDFKISKGNNHYVFKKDAIFNSDETSLVAILPGLTDKTYTVKKGVEKVYSYAFSNDALVKVELPESLAYVGFGAFANAHNLEAIEAHKKNATFNSLYGALYSSGYSTLVAYPHAATYTAKALVNLSAIRYDAFLGASAAQQKLLRPMLAAAPYVARAPYTLYDQTGADACAPTVSGESTLETQARDSDIPFEWEPIDANCARIVKALELARNVEIPDVVDGRDVVEIASSTFDNNEWQNVQTLRLPSKLRAIELWKPENDDPLAALTAFEIDESNPNFKTVDGALFSKDGARLVLYPRGKKEPVYLVPATTVAIAERAFANASGLVSIILSPGLASVERYAFANCAQLASVVPPPTTRSIAEGAFFGCSALVMAQIPEGVERLERSTFESCGNLVSVAMPQSVCAIAARAFANCAKLAALVVPPKVVEIGEDAIPATTLVQASAGSVAEAWARANNRPFSVL